MKKPQPPFLFHELADLFGRGEVARASVLFRPEHALMRSAENEALINLAIYAGSQEAVEFLLPHSDLRAVNNDQRTPLMCAIVYTQLDMIPSLAPKSDLTQRDEDGLDVLTMLFDNARLLKIKPRCALALLNGCEPDEPLPEGRRSPFLQAFYAKNWTLVDAFLPLMDPDNAALHKEDLADKVSFYAEQEAEELRTAIGASTPSSEAVSFDAELPVSRAARRI